MSSIGVKKFFLFALLSNHFDSRLTGFLLRPRTPWWISSRVNLNQPSITDSEVVELEIWFVLKNIGDMKVLNSRSRSSTHNRTRLSIVCCEYQTTNWQWDCSQRHETMERVQEHGLKHITLQLVPRVCCWGSYVLIVMTSRATLSVGSGPFRAVLKQQQAQVTQKQEKSCFSELHYIYIYLYFYIIVFLF